MDMQSSIKICFKKFADFSGRASRSEFWWFHLFYIIVIIVAAIFDSFYVDNSQNMGPVELVSYLILLLPSLAVTARRLHDVDKSGWWMLIALTLIGLIPLFVWYVSVGTKKKNKFGPPLKLKK
jgi:uncharacterized membrane protein YhaH (DUF805 family)|tara:strand:- start:149 stop:517 length:369 start_codon:yes stop_codon:yes gene_type:complete